MSIRSVFGYISHGLSHVLYVDPSRIDIALSQFDEQCNSMLERLFGSQS